MTEWETKPCPVVSPNCSQEGGSLFNVYFGFVCCAEVANFKYETTCSVGKFSFLIVANGYKIGINNNNGNNYSDSFV